MVWWKSPKSSANSTSSSAAYSPSDQHHHSFRWNGTSKRHDPTKPFLTRQRKIRHLSDIEVRNFAGDDSRRKVVGVSASENSTPVSRSPTNLYDVHQMTSRSDSSPTLLAHPLPLPDVNVVIGTTGEGLSGRWPFPSPRGWGQNGGGGVWDEASGSRPVYATIKSPERFELPGVVPSVGHRRTMFQYPGACKDDFRLNIPTRSAPTSVLSSPMRSPQIPNYGGVLPSGYFTPQAPQTRSTYEFSEFVTGLHSRRSADLFASPDPSPLQSPTARSLVLRSRIASEPSSPLHQKMVPDNSARWHDTHGGVNVHPLPLPPSAPTHFSSSYVHPPTMRIDTSAMGNQWIKGKLIGSGTFGSVYRATNRHTGALCAMKEVNLIPDDTKSAECIKQLQQEIKLLSQLEHPNIVQYLGSEIIDDRFYIYLEYVFPGSMKSYIQDQCGVITESIVRNFTRHILKGLSYLHSKGAIHRDIKGANLLVNSDGVVKLADFGMAKYLTEAKFAYSMSGTPYWMAPEVLHASMNKEIGYNSAVDIWSLGCTIIEMFTGEQPWSGLSPAAAMFKVLHESPRIPETLSSEGKDFLKRCFHRNPAERPSANELLEQPFLTNTHPYDLNNSTRALAGLSLSDASPSNGNPDAKEKSTPYSNEIIPTHPNSADTTTPFLCKSPESTLDEVRNLSPIHYPLTGHSSNSIHCNTGDPQSFLHTREEIFHFS